MSDPLQSIWKNQSADAFAMSLADIHARARTFQSRVRRRNWIEYIAALFVIAGFLAIAVLMPSTLIRVGAVLIALGAVYVCWKLHQLGRAGSKTELDAALSVTDFHRAQLVRQRDALKTVWRWYLAPFAPGMVVFVAGTSFEPALQAPLLAQVGMFLTGLAFQAAVFAGVALLNAFAVKHLDKEIAALDQARAV